MLRIITVVSLVCSLLAIGSGIVANHNSTIAQDLARGDLVYRVKVASVILPIWGVACWPWVLACVRATEEDRRFSILAFAGASGVLAVYFYSGIATAPSEGVGVLVILYYVLAWVLYPLTLKLRRE
jgi:hypothetical protein